MLFLTASCWFLLTGHFACAMLTAAGLLWAPTRQPGWNRPSRMAQKRERRAVKKSPTVRSCRRTDAMNARGRLYEQLIARYGRGNVFKDIDSIAGGDVFAKAITGAIAQCALQLVVIGQHWLEARDEQGRRRLDDP